MTVAVCHITREFFSQHQDSILGGMYSYEKFKDLFPDITHALLMEGRLVQVGPGVQIAKEAIFGGKPQ